ncbi:MAG: hypothetical protein Q9213_001188 [Squamulea squamosa]
MGTPKEVDSTHRNLSSAAKYQQAELGFNNTSRVYSFAAYTVDVGWTNFVHTLTSGGCLCVPSDATRASDLVGSMNALNVNVAELTPSVARLLDPAKVTSLEKLLLTGEPMSREDVATWSSRVILYTIFGPSELPGASTICIIDPRDEYFGSVGRGNAYGVATWILCEDKQQLAQIGAVGELWLESPVLAKGYHNNPGKTASDFVDDPPWLLRGGSYHKGRRGRVYRTGDLVRYNTDGTLAFLGRKDHQVKVHGQRVELGDIEHHVRLALSQKGIRALVAVDMVTPHGKRDPTVAAFIKTGQHESLNADRTTEIAAYLEDKLAEWIPVYMIPRKCTLIDSMPATPSESAVPYR